MPASPVLGLPAIAPAREVVFPSLVGLLTPIPNVAERSDYGELFRLAGTFMTLSPTGVEHPRAIVQIVSTGQQRLMRVGASLAEGVTLRRIQTDHIVLATGDGDVTLLLNGAQTAATTESDAVGGGGTSGEEDAARFLAGRRVSEQRWHFTRDGLMAYYGELRNEPARLLDVFDSMKPVRNAEQKITGYRLGIEGEKFFFDAIGLREGDIIRSVNSLEMTNRGRAEALIEAFVRGSMNTVVLELERGGGTTEQIYLVDPTELEQ